MKKSQLCFLYALVLVRAILSPPHYHFVPVEQIDLQSVVVLVAHLLIMLVIVAAVQVAQSQQDLLVHSGHFGLRLLVLDSDAGRELRHVLLQIRC